MTAPYQWYRRLIVEGPSSFPERTLFLFLLAASRVYGLVVLARIWAYRRGILRRHKAGIPVISVGNITVGGTGKTPVVDDLVRRGLAAGKRVVVISRGYGGRRQAATAVVSDGKGRIDDRARLYGDEPVLLARRNPQAIVIVARRRSDGVLLAEKMGADLAILDDGFQHLAVARNLDIVLIDCRDPFGNRRLLPAGPLREPLRGLQRADLLVLTRFAGTIPAGFEATQPVLTCQQVLADTLLSLAGERTGWEQLRAQRCVAFAGIAVPDNFFESLRELGLKPVAEIPLRDHQEFDSGTLARLRAACKDVDACVTTEKDAVKLTAGDLPVACWVVPLHIRMQPEQQLVQFLTRIFS